MKRTLDEWEVLKEGDLYEWDKPLPNGRFDERVLSHVGDTTGATLASWIGRRPNRIVRPGERDVSDDEQLQEGDVMHYTKDPDGTGKVIEFVLTDKFFPRTIEAEKKAHELSNWTLIKVTRKETEMAKKNDKPDHGRLLGDDEVVQRGDIMYEDGGDMTEAEMSVVMTFADDGRTVGELKKDYGYVKVMRPTSTGAVDDLKAALDWAWENGMFAADDMENIKKHRAEAMSLLGKAEDGS